MKLQDQVCTLEQAKKLKELGVKQRVSAFTWRTYKHGSIDSEVVFGNFMEPEDFPNLIPFDAFTVAELGIMLPEYTETEKRFGSAGLRLNTGGVYWRCRNTNFDGVQKDGITEAQSKAEQLIQLLENNSITVEEVNERL